MGLKKNLIYSGQNCLILLSNFLYNSEQINSIKFKNNGGINMSTNPNQTIVRIESSPCDDIHLCSMRNIEAECAAARDLKYSTMILWLYCSQYQDGDKFILSPKAVKEIMGMSERTYTRCKDELIEKGYLVKVGDNQYMFYEMPRK